MSDKCNGCISFRVPEALESDYNALPEADKKLLKEKILDLIGRTCWVTHHYNHNFYFNHSEVGK